MNPDDLLNRFCVNLDDGAIFLCRQVIREPDAWFVQGPGLAHDRVRATNVSLFRPQDQLILTAVFGARPS